MINFISQSLKNLTFGAKIYILFQCIYLIGALFFTYVQFQLLQELRKKKLTEKCFCEKKFPEGKSERSRN